MTARPDIPEGKDEFKLNEVCKLASVQPYMLRFWGSEFPQLEAGRSGSGQRLYSRDQVDLILEIRRLLFDEGLTIAGARKRLGDAGEPGDDQEQADSAAKKRSPRKKKAKKEAPAAASTEEEKAAPQETVAEKPTESEEAASRKSPSLQPEEVDKIASERVKPLLATLTELRSEISDILRELRTAPE